MRVRASLVVCCVMIAACGSEGDDTAPTSTAGAGGMAASGGTAAAGHAGASASSGASGAGVGGTHAAGGAAGSSTGGTSHAVGGASGGSGGSHAAGSSGVGGSSKGGASTGGSSSGGAGMGGAVGGTGGSGGAVTGGSSGSAGATTSSWVQLAHAADPSVMAGNPMKGFVRFAGENSGGATFPHTLEYLDFAVADVMTAETTFDWSKLDARLDAIAANHHWAIVRPWLDTPGDPSGVPGYLLADGIATHSYTDYGNGPSVSPDYGDARVVAALSSFVGAFGAHLDGDARVAVVQAGLLGFWGEWHTYPHDDWFAPDATQMAVLDAYAGAFTKTKLEVRTPHADSVALGFGYHDDAFAQSTLPPTDWHFWPSIVAAGGGDVWKTQPIGGELYPPFQSTIFDVPPAPAEAEPFADCVTTTHASWLLDESAFAMTDTGAKEDRILTAAASLGYQLTVVEALLPDAPTSSPVTIEAHVTNEGVAPFYLDWSVRVATGAASAMTDAKLSALLPGTTATWTATLDAGWAGESLLLCVDAAPAGHPSIHFANAEDGTVQAGCVTLRK